MPGRGLCYAKPVPVEQGGGIECLCDCATMTILHVNIEGALAEAREIAFTCDGCQSAHWLTLYPVQEQT
jgi:hypothetical protein